MSNQNTQNDDMTDLIHSIMKGTKPTEHAKHHIDVANRKMSSPDEIHKHYDISGDMDKEKPLDASGIKPDSDNDEDDLEYIKHKMGMDKKGEVHVDDDSSDYMEKDPVAAGRHVHPGMSTPDKRVKFSDYAKDDSIRREHLRKAKIHYAHK